MKKLFLALVVLAVIGLGWGPTAGAGEVLVQFSTIDALLGGLYDGTMTLSELKAHGNLGIGTFDGLDGEMILLHGQVYRVGADGRAVTVSDSETTPFAAVTFFDAERELALSAGTGFDGLSALLAETLSANFFHALLIEGRFKTLRTRSVPRQQPPYRPLVEVVKEQPIFDFEEVEGVLVGFYCPPFVSGINVPGYHLHFLTADRRGGGHVLDFSVAEATLKVDTLSRFMLHLPNTGDFAAADLRRDRQGELEKVEK